MNEIKKSSLFKDGDDQVIKVPHGFELPGTEITVTKDGDRLIIEPARVELQAPQTWAEFLDALEPVDVDWPDIDEGLLPADDINLE